MTKELNSLPSTHCTNIATSRTVIQASKIMGIGPTTAWDLIKKRLLGHYRIGRRVVVTDQHIADYLKRAEVPAVETSTSSTM